jgi:hypothetical protein
MNGITQLRHPVMSENQIGLRLLGLTARGSAGVTQRNVARKSLLNVGITSLCLQPTGPMFFSAIEFSDITTYCLPTGPSMNDQLYTLLDVTRLPIGGWAKFLRTTAPDPAMPNRESA